MLQLIQKLFRNPALQRHRRLRQMRAGRLSDLQSSLPNTTCVDVGASYYPHTSWWIFLESSNTTWIAVEPNENNLTYVKNWPWPASIETVTKGLSKKGGEQILYVTNVDSGSSLLRPVVQPSMSFRTTAEVEKYFFPVREVTIETVTLVDVVSKLPHQPMIVKLDTQGSELSILESVLEGEARNNLVGVEIECSLLAKPYYEDSPRLWDVAKLMESNGFEAIDVDVIPRSAAKSKISSHPKQIVNECDAVFALRPDVASTKSPEMRAALLGFYVTNCFYAEAARSLDHDPQLLQYLESRGCNVARLRSELRTRSNKAR